MPRETPSIVTVLRAWLMLFAGLCLGGASGAVHADPVRSNAAEAELVSRAAAIVPGQRLELGLRLKLDPGWHVYWKNAGDSGTPPALDLQLPQGFRAGELLFPFPKRIPIAHLVNYGFEGEVLFPIHVDVPAALREGDKISVRARAAWLECKESCLPASADLALTLPVSPIAGTSIWSALFEATQARLPGPLPPGGAASVTAASGGLTLALSGLAACGDADFFPDREGLFVHAKIARVAAGGDSLLFNLPAETNATLPSHLTGVLTCAVAGSGERAYEISAPTGLPSPAGALAAQGPAAEPLTFMLAIVFAFVGGLALNLMPCVFPVLALKILSLTQHGYAGRGERSRHAGGFLVGVLLSFGVLAGVMLALRAAGEEIGWGFQLQSPLFVSAMALLFFTLALNLSGYFEFGSGLQSLAGRAGAGRGGPLFDGALAVAVASPCTAPLMGAAIGYTLAQPTVTVLAVFAALGLGMALPYVILVLRPSLTRRLPRSGPWLASVRELFAFPLYATVLWLVWVLGELSGLGAGIRLLLLMLAVALGIWLWQRRATRAVARAIAIVVVSASVAWLHAGLDGTQAGVARAAENNQWQPWSAAAFEELRRQGKPVLVDFTAAWCITCQVNKHAVLHTEAVTRALQETGTLAMRADWTRRDPDITRALTALGRNGVPVYALYDGTGGVELLPEILTTTIVIEALQSGAAQRVPTQAGASSAL